MALLTRLLVVLCAGMDFFDVASTCSSFSIATLYGSHSCFPVSLPRDGGHWYNLLRTLCAFPFFLDSYFYPLASIVSIIWNLYSFVGLLGGLTLAGQN